MKYRRLSIIEIVYFDKNVTVKTDVEKCLLEQLNTLCGQLLCVSIVVNGDVVNTNRLHCFIHNLKKLNVAISLTFCNWKRFETLVYFKSEVGQLRLTIDEDTKTDVLPKLFGELKTTTNNVIFLFEVAQIDKFKKNAELLQSNEFIYNVTYSPNVDQITYWNLAKYVSYLKKQFPLKIFHEFTCAGIVFDNIKGICPAKLSLMCVDTYGNIGFCRKDLFGHGLSIFDGGIMCLFEKLERCVQLCSSLLCDDKEYQNCLCGCPLDMKHSNNKYCKYMNN